jgi:DNA polymerase III delta subunit
VSPSELAKAIEAGRFEPVYYFYGSEDYRVKEAEKKLVGIFLPKPQQATNYTILSAAKGKIEDILTELSMIPMLGERQVFVVNSIQSLSQKQIEKILNILTPPDRNRIVIFASPSAKTPRKTTKLFKFLVSKTTAVEFTRLPTISSRGKIRALLKEGGIEKMIKSEDVAAVSSDFQSFKVFELTDQAAVGHFDKALSIIDFLLNKGEKPSGLLYWFGEHFINLYLTKNRKPIGAGKKDMSWKYKNQVDLFDNLSLESIIRLIADANYDLRNNIKPEKLILEKLIFNICSLNKKTADV